MDIQSMVGAAAAVVLIPSGFWALGKFGPGLIIKKIHEGFEDLRNSDWVRNPDKPKRARMLLALIELLEDEIPEPGTGKEIYDAIGAEISGRVHLGTAAQWSKVTQQFGDALDTECDDEIKELGAPPTPPAS